MAYTAPSVGTAGLVIPSFDDIFNFLLANFQSIYGATVDLEPASSDYQLLSIFALALSDSEQMGQLVYNNQSPNFAVGAGLSSLVKLNGLARKVATASTCVVTVVGVNGTTIPAGQVQDINGNLWDLPPNITIMGGSLDVLATAQELGAINITAPNQITTIVTVTAGWLSVNNNSNVAAVGQPVETDAQLRARQAISTELPSISPLAGTIAAIAAVPGVTRYNVLENPTGSTDAFGNPPHSITAVVEGGTLVDIATAIYLKKTIGCFTNGTITVPITDPNSGNVTDISFDLPTDVQIYVIVNAHLLAGGTSATITAIQTALVNYLNSLQIGELVSYGALIAVAMSVNPNLSAPIVSVHSLFFARTPTPTTITDVVLLFNEVADGLAINVQVNSI